MMKPNLFMMLFERLLLYHNMPILAVACFYDLTAHADPVLRASIMVCEQNANALRYSPEEDTGFGLSVEMPFSESWFVHVEGCLLSSRNPELDIDLKGFEGSTVFSNGGSWGSLGVGRRFFDVIFLRSDLHYLEDKTWYYLYTYEDHKEIASQDVRVVRPLIGIGGTFGIIYPSDNINTLFGSIGIVRHFYNFKRRKIEHQLYKTTAFGISFGI